MASNTPPATPQSVIQLISKLNEADPDFRFMALNDMINLLENAKPDFLHHEYNVAARASDAIIKAVDDQNGEVQNLAIKCLGPLVAKVPATIIGTMIEKILNMDLKSSPDNAVRPLALRTTIMSLPRPTPGAVPTKDVQDAYFAVSRTLIPRLISSGDKAKNSTTGNSLLLGSDDLTAESVDVLIEVVKAFGPILQSIEVEAMTDTIFKVMESDKGSSLVKKRSVIAISILASFLTDELLLQLATRISSALQQDNISAVSRRMYFSILGSITRSVPQRFGPHLPALAPHVLKALGAEELQKHMELISDGDDSGTDFNDVCESALIALEAFLSVCPSEMETFTEDAVSSCLRFLKYDPNLAIDDEDDDEAMNEEEDELDDDEDDMDDDDDFGDEDDDPSWKVRRCAAKALQSFISTRASGNLHEGGILYKQAAPALVKRFDEREENVRLEIINCLALLIRKTDDSLLPGSFDWNLDGQEDELPTQLPVNRKRRRQSSVAETGPASPILEKATPTTGPGADLAKLTPSIVKASVKHFKGKIISSKQAIFTLFDDMVRVQRGGFADYLNDIVSPAVESIKNVGSSTVASSLAGSGGNASATPSTLRVVCLRLLTDIAKTHTSNVLQPHLPKMVDAVVAASNDRFYKTSCEAIRTAEEIVKNVTPPRSKVSSLKFKTEIQKIYQVVMDRSTQQQVDGEVRQRAIQALGVLLARTSHSEGLDLIDASERQKSMDMLADGLKSEIVRLAAVRAIDTIAAFCRGPGQLDANWTVQVALELSSQLRKAHRGLRVASVQALKHLVISPSSEGTFDAATITRLVEPLEAVIVAQDTHLLAPALLILSRLSEENAELVVTEGLTSTICRLLKSSHASIALDQLLSLTTHVGKSGRGSILMMGLLSDVSIDGDPAIVGKVIGTLLVFSGDSAGVTLDSFITELESSSVKNDVPRICLALAVLGEAALQLGSKSSLKPELFLKQFRAELDKVSLAAAVALGRAGSGNVSQYLPVILQTMERGGNTQYLLIQSIKEILQQVADQSTDIAQHSSSVWEHLLAASKNPENTVVCAECVGRLVINDPKAFMPELQSILKDENDLVRGMAVQAVRYTLPDSDDTLDAMFKDVLPAMLLTMLRDHRMDNRRLAMSTLNSAAHNKPDLILPHLGELMPLVLHESVIKPELIREVQMGPFKHYVDDGIEVRKSAYEMLYAIMETAYTRINKHELFDRIIAGLKDDNDIRSLCNLMVSKLATMDPDETGRRLDSIAEAYRTVLSTKLREGSVKQEVEKQEEANRSVLRVSLLLGDKLGRGTGASSGRAVATSAAPTGGAKQAWDAYWEWMMRDFAAQVKQLHQENTTNNRTVSI